MNPTANATHQETNNSSRPEMAFVLLGIAALLLIQWVHFMSGYRVTADDVMFYWHFIEGWDKVWENASEMAVFSGRIGHYLMTPLNAVGAYFAGNPFLRGIMVLGHFGVILVFCIYAARLLVHENRYVVALFLFLVLLSLHPLAYGHVPPNAYPLQNTVPFLMILGTRLLILRQHGLGPISGAGVYLSLAVAMLVSEFALLFATALMAAEHVLILTAEPRAGKRCLWGNWTINGPRLAADAAVALGVLALYLGFRWYNPSQYMGNQPDGLSEPGEVLYTALAHIFAGVTLPHLDMHLVTQAGLPVLLQACTIGLITFACSRHLIAYMPLRASAHITGIIALTLTLMLYIALPLALNERAQDWCIENGTCFYLDSRVSVLGVAILGFCIVTLIRRNATGFPRATALTAFSVTLGVMAAATHLHNRQTAESMARAMASWERAERLACNDQMAAISNAAVWRLVDPNKRVSFHPWLKRGAFWRDHINAIKPGIACNNRQNTQLLEKLNSHLRLPVSFAHGNADRFLDSGWSYPEKWGVWSDGRESVLSFELYADEATRLEAVALSFQLYFGPSISEQQIGVSVNDNHVVTWDFDERPGPFKSFRRVIPMPEDLNKGKVTISLTYDSLRDHTVKGESIDPRALAFGLEEMEWLNEPKR